MLECLQVVTGEATQTVFYVEGIGTSPTWGGDTIKVRVYPLGAGQGGEDLVSYSVVRCVYKVCVLRPYVCLRDASGEITSRQIFRTNYSSPSNMLACYVAGIAQPDDHETFHELSASMGHAFARLEVRSPDHAVGLGLWTGQTGMNKPRNYIKSYSELKAGRLWWFRANDGEQDDPVLAQSRYTQLYAAPLPDSKLKDPDKGMTETNMLAIREFRVRPEVCGNLLHYRNFHPFGGYGLDTILRAGTKSRIGCGSYVGVLTEYAGVADTSSWIVDRYMPEVPLPNISINPLAGGAYLAYCTGNGAWLRAVLRAIQSDAMPSVAAFPGITAWGDKSTGRSLRFCDPGKMMDWVDDENATTQWAKDRGVTVRHDVPAVSDLSGWRNR